MSKTSNSGPLRSKLVLAKTRAVKNLQSVYQADDFYSSTDSITDKRSSLATHRFRFQESVRKLENSSAELRRIDSSWIELCTDDKTEETLYNQHAMGNNEDGFLHLMHTLEDHTAACLVKIDEIDFTAGQLNATASQTSVPQARQQATTTAPSQASSVFAKLPKLNTETFDGTPTKWQEFIERFNETVDCQNLSEASKLTYLKSLTSGTAKRSIQKFASTDGGYKKAIELLTKKFGDTELIREEQHTN